MSITRLRHPTCPGTYCSGSSCGRIWSEPRVRRDFGERNVLHTFRQVYFVYVNPIRATVTHNRERLELMLGIGRAYEDDQSSLPQLIIEMDVVRSHRDALANELRNPPGGRTPSDCRGNRGGERTARRHDRQRCAHAT